MSDERYNADGQKVEFNEDTDRYEPVDGEVEAQPEPVEADHDPADEADDDDERDF